MSEDEWYWLQAGESRGPAAKAELERLLQAGEVRADTLIWRPGQDRWKSIAETWSHVTKQPPPLPTAPCEIDQPSRPQLRADPFTQSQSRTEGPGTPSDADIRGKWSASTPRPWRRYFARMLDITVNGAITVFAIAFVFALIDANASESFFSSVSGNNRIVDTMLTVAAGIPLNALLIGLTGGSLGKWLFGVRVLSSQGTSIGFGAALSREGAIWLQGLALGIPLVSLLTMIFAWRTLTTTGSTSWDATRSIVIVYRPMGAGQVIGAIAGVSILLCAIVGLVALGS